MSVCIASSHILELWSVLLWGVTCSGLSLCVCGTGQHPVHFLRKRFAIDYSLINISTTLVPKWLGKGSFTLQYRRHGGAIPAMTRRGHSRHVSMSKLGIMHWNCFKAMYLMNPGYSNRGRSGPSGNDSLLVSGRVQSNMIV